MFLSKKTTAIFLLIQFGIIGSSLYAQNSKMVSISGGSFIPLYGATEQKNVTVIPFQLDVYPVTNAEYLAFVKKYPDYQERGIIENQAHNIHQKTGAEFRTTLNILFYCV